MKSGDRAASLLIVALLAGCVPAEREMRIDYELNSLKKRVALLEQGATAQGESARQIELLSKRQADLQAGQEGLKVELRTLRGLIDETSARRREDADGQSLAQQELTARISGFDGRLAALEEGVAGLRSAPAAPPETVAPPVAATATETPALLYSRGRDAIQKGDAAAGREKMEEFIRLQPESEMVPNAHYWIGESYYVEKNYEGAIVQFQDVIEKYPNHAKAASALLKQGLAFRGMDEKKKGDALLRKVIESYPKSEEAGRAKALLAEKKSR